MMNGSDYRRVLDVAPGLAGSKHTGGNMSLLGEIIDATPSLSHFVVDSDIVAGSLAGSPGFYSFIANLSPQFALDLMSACSQRDWETASSMAKTSQRFFRRWLAKCSDINSSSALAKIATRAGVFPEMPLAIKEPYSSGTERHVTELRELVAREFPELATGQQA